MSNCTVVKNAFFLYALTISNYCLSLLLLPYLSRVLSVEAFGVIGFATSLCLIFQMIIEYGFQISTTATVSLNRDDKRQVSKIISNMTCAKLVLAVLSIVLFVLCSFAMESIREHVIIVSLFFVDAIIKALLPDAYFRGIERMKDITIRAVGAKSGILIIVVLFVKSDASLILYPSAMIICDLIALMWAFWLLWRDGLRIAKISVREVLFAIKQSFWYFISRISVSVNSSLGSLFLGTQFSPNSIQMGLYSGATRISTAGEQMIPPVGDALYPSIMKSKDFRLFSRILAFGGVAWGIICLFVSIFSTPLCIIILGSQYADAGQLLRILMVGVFVGFFSYMFGYPALSPIGKATWANLAIMISAVINLTICSVLWFANAISPLSVAIVFSTSNIWTFLVRFSAFMFFRPKH